MHMSWHSCIGQRTFCGIWFSPSQQGSLGSNLGVRLGSKCLYLLNHLICLFLYIFLKKNVFPPLFLRDLFSLFHFHDCFPYKCVVPCSCMVPTEVRTGNQFPCKRNHHMGTRPELLLLLNKRNKHS